MFICFGLSAGSFSAKVCKINICLFVFSLYYNIHTYLFLSSLCLWGKIGTYTRDTFCNGRNSSQKKQGRYQYRNATGRAEIETIR